MRITNRLGLPEPLVDAVSADSRFKPGVYRVTSLLKGTREILLERRHDADIEQDVSDMVWLIFGTAVHSIVENAQEAEHQIKEARLSEEILPGMTVTGRFDLYDAKLEQVIDYKTASVWKVIYRSYADWRKQLELYALLLLRAGFPVKRGRVVAFLKDHSKRDAKTKAGYPQFPVEVVDFDIAPDDLGAVEEWVKWKLTEIAHYEDAPDEELPLCTMEERYNDGPTYAVMKRGAKRALRVLPTETEAIAFSEANPGTVVEVRPGEDKKCRDYCTVSGFCPYWRDKLREEAASEQNDSL